MDPNFPKLDIESDTSLLQPDMNQLREDRFERNRAFLQSVNPRVAEQILPSLPCSKVEGAAITIQRSWRGYQGRKIYTTRLYERYLEEEEQQHEKVLQQMEEGELLIENHQLEVLLDDGKTTRRNADRFRRSKVIIIQRAWRQYIEGRQKARQLAVPPDKDFEQEVDSNRRNSNHSNSNQATASSGRTTLGDLEKCSSGITNDKNVTLGGVITDCVELDQNDDDDDDFAFINPLAEPSQGTEKTVDQSEELGKSNPSNTSKQVDRNECRSRETNEELLRKQRKLGYLAQAKQFVELKKLNSNVLPFDLHILAPGNPDDTEACQEMSETMTKSAEDTSAETENNDDPHCDDTNHEDDSRSESFQDTSDGKQAPAETVADVTGIGDKTAGDKTAEKIHSKDAKAETKTAGEAVKAGSGDISAFDVYNIETALPNIDWTTLEETLKAASEEEKKIREARRNDREEIRKKLAMGDDDDFYDDNDTDDVSYKKPSFQSRLHSGLQICFMNESPGDTDSEGRSPRQHEFHDNMKLDPKVDDLVDSDNNLRTVQDLNQTCDMAGTSATDTTTTTIQNCSPPRLKQYLPDGKEDPTDFHSKQEQLQNEAKLALAQAGTMAHMQLEIEKQLQKKSPMAEMVGIPGLGERRQRKKLTVRQLQEMNLAQIQVLYNDLQTQIENLNEELVHLLMERDELHMEQDSMLVDIEDLTRRAEELADKAKDVKNNVKGKLSTR